MRAQSFYAYFSQVVGVFYIDLQIGEHAEAACPVLPHDASGHPFFAFPRKSVHTVCVCTMRLYVSLLPDGQLLTLGEEVEEYLCLPVSSVTTSSGDE